MLQKILLIIAIFLFKLISLKFAEEIIGCGGFVKSNFYIQYSKVDIKLYTKQGSLKYKTDCAPNNGYYLIPLYDKGDYILKIEPPSGWSFEPESVALHVDGSTDPCSRNQDINFDFRGFTVFGKVLSYFKDDGPTGVKLMLKKPNNDVLQETETEINGSYTFTGVLPGNYMIEAFHSTWLFDQNIEEVKVDKDNVKTENKIVVAGFDVTGYVSSEEESIQGVHFLLFSREKSVRKLTGCSTEIVEGFDIVKGLHYICHVTSQSDGTFLFTSVPNGKYTLCPFYKGEHIEFDVSPSLVEFEVKNNGYSFTNSFQVEGFSVSGRVLDSLGGKGLEGAEIYINGKLHTMTKGDGIYHLENMRAGLYDIEVKKDHYLFNDVTIKVTPNTPQLRDIYASMFDICGHVEIDFYPPGLSQSNRIVELTDITSNSVIKIKTETDGTFCTKARGGRYVIEPIVSNAEKENGLKFIPPKHQVTLENRPLLDISFKQFLALVKGQVNCIEKCMALKIEIMSSFNDGIHLETTISNEGNFKFERCLPGKYLLILEKGDYCFESERFEFQVNDKDVLDLKLYQSGYKATLQLSHSSNFKIKYPSKKIIISEWSSGIHSLCLPEPGIYEFSPAGCHLYQTDIFTYNTNIPSEIILTPSKHRVTGTLIAAINDSHINVYVEKQANNEQDIILLTDPEYLKNGSFQYNFSFFIEPYTELEIKAASPNLLFYPPITYVKVLDECIENAVYIIGKKGLFINGIITPVLENVKIKILDKKNNTVISEIFTNEAGTFKVGPLHDNEYVVTAEKEGYFFTPQGKLGCFKAYKLAEITVKVENEYGKPLPGVLLSLSGGVDYRKNSLTRKDGKISFIGLSPGQYFLRPMLKEYQFQPSTKMIDIKEGTQINVHISGKRVAYSLFGIVNSLTGEAEVGVAVEVVGIGSCNYSQEDAISEQGGTFRIRGLQPSCNYSLRIKMGNDVNHHIERATPKEHIFTVNNSDINDIRIIVFRHFSQLDVSGCVSTNQEYLSTLRVRLYNVENQDQPLHTVNVGRSAFFYLPSLPIDEKKQYTLYLDSSLSTSSYQYQTSSLTFLANTSFYHFSFTFIPITKLPDQELNQGSILALPLTILVIVVVYNYPKFQGYLHRFMQTVSSSYQTSHSSDAAPIEPSARKKFKPRKAQ